MPELIDAGQHCRKKELPLSLPCSLLNKKDGSIKPILDSHAINKLTKIDAAPIQRCDDLLQTTKGADHFLAYNHVE